MTAETDELTAALRLYRTARTEFLEALGCARSNRDPFAEFAEVMARTRYSAARSPRAGSRAATT